MVQQHRLGGDFTPEIRWGLHARDLVGTSLQWLGGDFTPEARRRNGGTLLQSLGGDFAPDAQQAL